MNRFFMRVGVLLLAMLVFSCVGVTLANRLIPVERIRLEHWILLFTLCAIFSLPVGILVPLGKKQQPGPEQEQPGPEDAPEAQAEPEPEPEAPTPAGLALERYGREAAALPPREEARRIPVMTPLFFPRMLLLEHYLWKDENGMLLFPTEEAVQREADGRMEDLELFCKLLQPLRVDWHRVEYYVLEQAPDRIKPLTLLRYRDGEGNPRMLLLGRHAELMLEEWLPGFDLQTRLEQQYPSSHRQIEDIKQKLEDVKELWQNQLISEEEYTDKKAELLVKL